MRFPFYCSPACSTAISAEMPLNSRNHSICFRTRDNNKSGKYRMHRHNFLDDCCAISIWFDHYWYRP